MSVPTEEVREKRRQARATWRNAHREEHRANQRRQAAARYLRRKQEAIAFLGGVCVVCGTTEDLEFDHIHPGTVSFRVAMNLHRRWETLLPELEKCQLLCFECHKDKTERERKARYLLTHSPAPLGVEA